MVRWLRSRDGAAPPGSPIRGVGLYPGPASSENLIMSLAIGVQLSPASWLRAIAPRTAVPSLRISPSHPEVLERVRAALSVSADARAGLALLGDKAFTFSRSGDAFVMHARSSRTLVALGDPVGPVEEWADCIDQFVREAARLRRVPAFYQVSQARLADYQAAGLSCHKLGEEAVVALPDFSMQGSHRRRLRQTAVRMERAGGWFEVVPAGSASAMLPELRAVSDEWLRTKKTREKGFSLGVFHPAYLDEFPLALVRHEGRIVGFANIWTGAPGSQIGIDLMRYTDDAPYGVMEYLFSRLFEWGRDQGYGSCTIGMAPLAGLEEERPTLWTRAGGTLYRHAEYFYNFKGVREYKSKFLPTWEPRYLAAPRGLKVALALTSVGVLVAGGLGGIVRR